jgi:lipid-A-disaccharide synthase
MVRLASRHPEYHFVIAGMSLIGSELYNKIIDQHASQPTNLSVLYDQTYTLLNNAYAAVVCSGTATLETCLFHVPQVVCYRANPVTIALARALVGNRINHIALVDLIDDSNVVTELLQADYNDRRLDEEFRLITLDTANRERMLEGYRRVEEKLGAGDAGRHAATEIIGKLKIEN